MEQLRDNYTTQLLQLLPNGELWEKHTPTNLKHVLEALAEELLKGHIRFEELLQNFLPFSTEEFLDEWEYFLGLPDECSYIASGDLSDEDRRGSILAKISGSSQNLTINSLNDLIKKQGWGVEVSTFSPFIFGISSLGDDGLNGDDGGRFYIFITLTETATAISVEMLECLLRKKIPAYIELILKYN